MRKETIVKQCRKIIDTIRRFARGTSIDGSIIPDYILTRAIMDTLNIHDKRPIKDWKKLLEDYRFIQPMSGLNLMRWLIHDYFHTESRIEDWEIPTQKKIKPPTPTTPSHSEIKQLDPPPEKIIIIESSKQKSDPIKYINVPGGAYRKHPNNNSVELKCRCGQIFEREAPNAFKFRYDCPKCHNEIVLRNTVTLGPPINLSGGSSEQ